MTIHDGRYVFTAGGEDCCVFQWRVNSVILDAYLRLGGTDMNPFYELLEGRRRKRERDGRAVLLLLTQESGVTTQL